MATKNIPVEGFTPGTDQVKRLRKTHDLWKKYSPLWDFYLAAYEGGSDFANEKNLFRHVRENEKDFEDRVERVHNLNYCEPLVDFFTNFIFNEPIDRNGGKDADFYNKFILDVNRKGDSVDDFMRTVEDDTQIFGMSYILVDAPRLEPGKVVTKYDEQTQGIRPYWVLVKPDEITDWVVDEFDRFLYAKRKQVFDEFDGDSVRRVQVFTEMRPGRAKITKVDITNSDKPVVVAEEDVDIDLDEVPLVVVRYKRSKRDPFVGLSFLRDFAYNNREIMNLTSLLQEFLYRQAFNILAKEVETSVPLTGQSEGDVGTANVLEFPKGAQAPKYISPPADPARFIQDERGRIKNEMFVRAAQDFVSEIFNGEKSSGFSQAQSFSKTVPFISSRADALERAENTLMRLTMKLMGKEWTGKIKYKDRYELTNLSDALTQLQILVRDFQMPSEDFVKTELKRLVHEYDDKLPPDQLAKIEKQIDDMDFKSWMAVQKQALVGRGSSPSEQQKPKGTGTLQEVVAEAKVNPNVAATKKLKPQKEQQ